MEILVTVAIIAVLASLLLGTVNNLKKRAASVECLGKMRGLGVAAHGYIADNAGLLPFRTDSTHWMINIAPYLGIEPPVAQIGNEPFTKAFLCPGDPSRSPRQLRTYRYQMSWPSPEGAPSYGRNNYLPNYYHQILRPSTHAMIFDIAYTGSRRLELWRFDNAFWRKDVDLANPNGNNSEWNRPHYDGKAMNILFSDGHAGKLSYPLPSETYHFDGK